MKRFEDRTVSQQGLDLQERVVEINRVVEGRQGRPPLHLHGPGGRRRRSEGVGVGYGKAKEVPARSRRASSAQEEPFPGPQPGLDDHPPDDRDLRPRTRGAHACRARYRGHRRRRGARGARARRDPRHALQVARVRTTRSTSSRRRSKALRGLARPRSRPAARLPIEDVLGLTATPTPRHQPAEAVPGGAPPSPVAEAAS